MTDNAHVEALSREDAARRFPGNLHAQASCAEGFRAGFDAADQVSPSREELIPLLYDIEELFRQLDRSSIRLDPDWPEEDFQALRRRLGNYLFPDVRKAEQ